MKSFSKVARGSRKTYSLLEDQQRMPSKYELTSSKLLYYPDMGICVANSVTLWHEKFGPNRHLEVSKWEQFVDPAELTYSDYVNHRQRSEVHLEHIIELHTSSEERLTQNSEWMSGIESCLAPMLFPIHALQMASGYIGSLALSGKIAICAAFQAADELRKIHHLAERIAQLRQFIPTLGEDRQKHWEHTESWQPLRKLIENLLIEYDWLRAFVALNLCVKPLIRACYLRPLEDAAYEHGDQITFYKLAALGADDQWHFAWALTLLQMVVGQNANNGELIALVFLEWQKKVLDCSRFQSQSLGLDESRYIQELHQVWQTVNGILNLGP